MNRLLRRTTPSLPERCDALRAQREELERDVKQHIADHQRAAAQHQEEINAATRMLADLGCAVEQNADAPAGPVFAFHRRVGASLLPMISLGLALVALGLSLLNIGA